MTIYCKFSVESAYERILKSVNIWWKLLARKCPSGHCPAERL